MKIGDEVYVHGYVDEIRNDVVIIRNEGGYFGTILREVGLFGVESADEPQTDCNGCKFVGWYDTEFPCANCIRKTKDYYTAEQPDCPWK